MRNSDLDLRAVIYSVRINTDNMSDDFERAAGFLLPVWQYARHWNDCYRDTSNRRGANISNDTLRGNTSSKTVVDIC